MNIIDEFKKAQENFKSVAKLMGMGVASKPILNLGLSHLENAIKKLEEMHPFWANGGEDE